MRNLGFLAVAMTLAVATLLFFGGADIAAAANSGSHTAGFAGMSIHDFMASATPHFALSIVAMRSSLAELTARAATKLAEITDDTAPEAARAIEADHAKILADIKKLQDDIAAKEQEDGDITRAAPIASPDAMAAARAANILDIGTRAGMEVAVIQEAIRSNGTVEAFRVRAFDHMAARAETSRTSPARVITDERETRRTARAEALAYRLGAPIPTAGPSAAARAYMQDGLVAIAAESVEHRGIPRNSREVEEIYTRAAMTTSDFPIIMESAVNRTLEGRYALAQPTYRRIARQRNFRDFRPHTIIKTGDFPMLTQVLEDGEIKFGKLTEGKETLQVASYARGIAVSRQLMINDDLGAIQDMLSSYGSTIALFEEILFYSQAFNGKLADGKNVFDATHNNLGAAAAIDVDPVSLGRAAMSKQKTLDGNPMLENKPSIIMTGPDRITSAEKLIASITPATVQNVNIFSGRLTPMDTAQISDNSWHLFADPSTGSNYRWGYLEGYEAPRVRLDTPFGRQGMAMTVEHDFGCGAVDYRYGYKNPGQ